MDLIITLSATAVLLIAGVAYLPQPQRRAIRVRTQDKRR
ncbi:MAG: hypothetical protein ACJAR9_001954 [Celeribacter sp.]|jgi:hypothetical protein